MVDGNTISFDLRSISGAILMVGGGVGSFLLWAFSVFQKREDAGKRDQYVDTKFKEIKDDAERRDQQHAQALASVRIDLQAQNGYLQEIGRDVSYIRGKMDAGSGPQA